MNVGSTMRDTFSNESGLNFSFFEICNESGLYFSFSEICTEE